MVGRFALAATEIGRAQSELQSRGQLVCRLLLGKKNAMRQAHDDGWFIVFDTLTLADFLLEAFHHPSSTLFPYTTLFRSMSRMQEPSPPYMLHTAPRVVKPRQ